jgi:hypothetical protein|tara:strand:+ start:1236 stop:1475 length:240 start_codon:yes stop_codon:yes gene_type:complete
MMKIEAISKKHQARVNKAVNWLLKYNTFNDKRTRAEDNGNNKEYVKVNRKCESSYDKFLENMDELPKREQIQIYKSAMY